MNGQEPNQFQTVEQAKAAIERMLTPVAEYRWVAIREALNQVLAEDILSPIDVPAHNNSAMDGYALSGSAIEPAGLTRLQVIGTALAGKKFVGTVAAGQCVRITTGAVMPDGCDTVVVQENVSSPEEGYIQFPPGAVAAGDNRRLAGEDLQRGKPAISAGKLIRPADLGLLASLGVPEVKVNRPLRVAFFSTGDELRSLGQPLDDGCVYDSNRYTLFGMLRRLEFVELIDLGVVQDSPEALEQAMGLAANQADVIITSGGVSVGEADFTKTVMQKLGTVNFWKIAMRPGRPMAFGRITNPDSGQSAVLFGLPGNPVAVMITFYAFVRDALHHLAGARARPLPTIMARVASPIRKKPGRTEYQRVRLERDAHGWVAHLTGAQGSGVLRSMSEADGLLVLRHEHGGLNVGDTAEVWPFEGLI
ncbi:molybdopterin molybdotransferase MoeA [Limnobacter humi]|uniref:Molybdopterin molybdenumtransferase n=1 Tax=Limnobacter humi TaxID=1778671 RepID=A0ABT1WHI5_9BURK|nr:gephyrin-like molybdotransferase Glp [Limnobacter humi]MCQ8895899.1 molybdopterin molybdotransferase MoeA [Limnobacter humi]